MISVFISREEKSGRRIVQFQDMFWLNIYNIVILSREKKRERGNFLFSREDYVSAINSYNKYVK